MANYAQTPRAKLYPTLQMSMEACIKLKNAKGICYITFEPDCNAYKIYYYFLVRFIEK